MEKLATSESNTNGTLTTTSPANIGFVTRSRASSPVPEDGFACGNAFRWLARLRTTWAPFCTWSYYTGDVDPETDAGPISGTMNRTNPSFDLSSNGLSIPDEITVKSFCEAARLLPKRIYHNLFLLRLPAMYSSRNTATDTYFNSLLREWKALNGASAVLTAAILALIIPSKKIFHCSAGVC
ncbi:hypothetical protein K443DRAFT_507215 [Laccaria amethystina LaAM-08-1]|uniref:Uncharacterized protein n=1 Tax=Laccaria amethystina LaAM-08-1 TaxID=1095629 RepID=A0A0C9WSR8_9AGAR|nr:hypothetical protein K443DRAFT_507215 [Laccaria amethystina LaAM-08-1]